MAVEELGVGAEKVACREVVVAYRLLVREIWYMEIYYDMYGKSLPVKVFVGGVFLDVRVSELCLAGTGRTSNSVLDRSFEL